VSGALWFRPEGRVVVNDVAGELVDGLGYSGRFKSSFHLRATAYDGQ
jgi:hypothetical protein